MFDGRTRLCGNSVTTRLKKSGQLICSRTRVIDISQSAGVKVVYLLVSIRVILATDATGHFQIYVIGFVRNSIGCDCTG